jgi:hypothetical protein
MSDKTTKQVTISYDTYQGLLNASGSMQGALQAVAPQLLPQQQEQIKLLVDSANMFSGRAIAEANTTTLPTP